MGYRLGLRAGVLHACRAQREIAANGHENPGYWPQFQHKTAQPRGYAAVSAGRGRAGRSTARAAEMAHRKVLGAKWAARATSGAGRSRIRGGTIT